MSLETWELMSYVVTVIGLPLAIAVFAYEQRKERENEDEEVYQLLSDNYQDFLKIALDHPDLRLLSPGAVPELNAEQRERAYAIFGMLVSLFERAWLLLHDDNLAGRRLQRWKSWEDYMREWCRREDFRMQLPLLLTGEDPGFASHIRAIAAQEAAGVLTTDTNLAIRDQ